jgi:hypothetical protein
MTTLLSPTYGFSNYYVFMDGFDEYGTISNVSKKWSSTNFTLSVLDDGRTAAPSSNVLSKSLLLKGTNSCQYYFESYTEFTLGFAFKIAHTSLPASTVGFAEFLQEGPAGSTVCGIAINSDGSLSSYGTSPSGDIIGTSATGIIEPDTWYYLEIYTKIDSGDVYTWVKVNNTDVIASTTFGSTDKTYISGISLKSASALTNGINFDDLKLVRINALLGNAKFFLGDAKIMTFVPTSTINLSSTQFTAVPSETDVNHHRPVSGSIPDNDSSYLRSSTSGSSELFGYDFAQLPESAIIHAIGFNNYARKTGVDPDAQLIVTENFLDGTTIRSYAVTGSGLVGAPALSADYSYVNTYLTLNGTTYERSDLINNEAGVANES